MASIVAYHADPGWFPLAPASLDVFFVLSTFLVTNVLLDSLARRGAPHGRRFFTRRARRLAAGLAAMLAVVVALLAFGVYKNPDTARTAVGAAMLHANVAQFSGDYFSAFAQRNPLEHTWSLSVEEHFYIGVFLAVTLLWLATRRNLRRTRIGLVVVAVAVGLASVVTARHLLSIGASPNRIYMGSDTRAVSAAAGVALAAVLWGRWDLRARSGSAKGPLGRVISSGAWMLGALVVTITLTRWHPTLEWFASGGWLVSAAASALFVAAAARSRLPGPISGNRVLQWAGRRSYGIYLWHLPLLVLAAEFGRLGIAVALIATCVAAEASHHFVEQRFRADGGNGGAFSNRTFVFATVGTGAVLALLAFGLPEPERPEWAGAPDAAQPRPEPPPPDAAESVTADPTPPAGAVPEQADASVAATSLEPVSVLVWGDNAAGMVGARLGKDPRFSVTTEAHPECTGPASCASLTPASPLEGTDAVVIAITTVDAFHRRIADPLDMTAPERAAGNTWLSWTSATAGTPVALGMSPEARRDLGVGLHLRRMAGDDPSNIVLGAEPDQWADALVDRFAKPDEASAPTKVMIVGDSVAYSLATAFRPEGTVVWDQSRHGCDPSPGDRVTIRGGRDRTPPACDWRTDWARAVQTWNPDVVLWHTGTWSSYDRYHDGRHLVTGTPEWHRAEMDAHVEALSILTSLGAEVVVAVVAPAWETAAGKPVETTPQESARRMPALLAAVRDAADAMEQVAVVDTADAICGTDCNRPDLREDGVHYTPEGARVVSDWLAQQIPAS